MSSITSNKTHVFSMGFLFFFLAIGVFIFIMRHVVKQEESFSSGIDPEEDLCVQAVAVHRRHNPKFSVCDHPSLQEFCPKQCSFTNNDDTRNLNCWWYQKSRGRCQRLPHYMEQQCPHKMCHDDIEYGEGGGDF